MYGILKRGGKVYSQIIMDAKPEILMSVIRCKIKPGSIACTDYWRSYNALDVSEFKGYSKIIYTKEKTH